MAYYSTNDFKAGLKVMLDGNPCSIMENEYVKPGKGQAFNRVKLRNLRSGKVLEKLSSQVTLWKPLILLKLKWITSTTMAKCGTSWILYLSSKSLLTKPQWVMLRNG